MLISIGTSVFIRVTLAYLLVHLSKSPEYPDGRPEMIHVSLLLTWLIGACINYLAYKYGRWRKKLPVDDGLSPDIPATYRKEKLS
jgi:Na+-driven multidrug efflux pump